MNKLITWFIKYPIWANVIKILVFAFGIVSIFSMRSSFFAELDSNIISISVTYPGASPEEIEKGVIQKIEDNLKGIKGIDRYTSRSRENVGDVTVEVFRGEDMNQVVQDVKNAVDRINSFPAGMEPVVTAKTPASEFAVSFGIYGVDDLHTLKNISRRIENDLRATEGISQIEINGFPEEEIVAFVNEDDMRKYGLTFDMVSRAIAGSNLDLSAGKIRTKEEEIIIRLEEKDYYAEQFEDIVVKAMPDGTLIRLNDVAEVKNTWAEEPQRTYINGQRAVVFRINKLIGENILDIAEMIKEYVAEFNKDNPEYNVIMLDDATKSLRGRIQLLIKNGSVGALLVILSLTLFLNVRLAFWVSLSIPFSFLGMFIAANMFGLTINVLSMFGAIMVVGILVDDGIVVGEQIYQNYENGKKAFRAALDAVIEVLPSISFAIFTTIAMFMPFFFLEGRQGESMRDMAFVVIFSLIFSLIEAAIILPSHLAHSKAIRGERKQNKFREKIDKILLYPRDKWYSSSLRFFLKNKIIGFAIIIFITVVTVGAFRGNVIQATFFPFIDSDSFEIVLTMPPGTRDTETERVLKRIEKGITAVNEKLSSERDDGKDMIKRSVVNIGRGKSGAFGAVNMGTSNQGVIQVVLLDGEIRNMRSYDIASMIREEVGPIYQADEVIYGQSSLFGKPVSISLNSPNLDDLESAKQELKAGIASIPELGDITDNDPKGFREIKLKLKPKAYILGLTDLEVARQIRQGYFGDEVQRLQRGQDEIKVWVRFDDTERSSIGKFEEMFIKLQNGNQYPLKELIEYKIERGKTVINHINGNREITVEADVVDASLEVPPILSRVENDILAPILAKYPSVKLSESGQKREILKTARSARVALPIAFLAVFFIITLSFRSYLQAFAVILLIPFGLIGAVWGHWIHGIPVNIFSAYGMIALIGIIVNAAIVFNNTLNRKLSSGQKFNDALFDTGLQRFRPILLTTVTTVLGFLPLLAEGSLQAQFLKPMAASVAYGLLVASFFTLMYLPMFLSMFNKSRIYTKWLWTGNKPKPEDVEPAIIQEKEIKKLMEK